MPACWIRFFTLFLLLGLGCVTPGCAYKVIKTSLKPEHVQPLHSLTQDKRLYVHELYISSWADRIDREVLNKKLAEYYPTVFVEKPTPTSIPLRVTITAKNFDHTPVWFAIFNACCMYASYTIIPFSWSKSIAIIAELEPTHFSNPTAKHVIANAHTLPEELPKMAARLNHDETAHYGLPVFSRIFFASKDYGPYCVNIGDGKKAVDDRLYEEVVAVIMAAYNKNPDYFENQSLPKRNKQPVTPSVPKAASIVSPQSSVVSSQSSAGYTIVRKHFDAKTNTGLCRVKFSSSVPTAEELGVIQGELRKLCQEAYQANSPISRDQDLLIINEGYRAIGKSLKLYEFTLTLGAVEFLELQYDNSTLLGSISIRLPGGNPENARKWVTENLDRLVEEYNISADEVIDGEYQLTSEKMSADGTYTVAFEVIN